VMITNDFLYAFDRVSWVGSLGISLDPWQKTVVKSNSRRHILLCSRQSGKSSMAALIALHTALYKDAALILIIANAKRQSQELFMKIKEYCNLIEPYPTMIADTMTSCTFANGSRIICLPGSDASIRGFSAVDLIIEDESSRVEDATYYATRPMLAVSNGRIMLLSTPFGKRGHFYEVWVSEEDWVRTIVTANQCPRISKEFLAEERAGLGRLIYDQEYNCIFQDLIDSVFSEYDINRAFDNDLVPLELGVKEWTE